jgi:aminoglycoside phosphotransferase (APT) family kinase protein
VESLISLDEMVEYIEGLNVTSEPAGGYTNEVRFGEYRGYKVLMKYGSGGEEVENVVKGYRACEALYGEVDFVLPEPVRLEREDGDVLAVISRIETALPSREEWKRSEHVRKTVEKGVEILNSLHSRDLSQELEDSGLLKEEDRIEQAMRGEIPIISSESDGETLEICREIIDVLVDNPVENKFSHNDFNIDNYVFQNRELSGAFDWENCGVFDRTRDVALLESAVVDEYGLFFHGDRAEDFREDLRRNIEHDFSASRLKLYRFFQNALAYSYVSSGQCSETWKAAGTAEEMLKHRRELLDERKPAVKDALQEVRDAKES